MVSDREPQAVGVHQQIVPPPASVSEMFICAEELSDQNNGAAPTEGFMERQRGARVIVQLMSLPDTSATWW